MNHDPRSPGAHITKGTRIRAVWFEATLACLAGAQAKVGATPRQVTGVVRHVRGDHPTNPTTVRLLVEADDPRGDMCPKCGVREVNVDPCRVVEVIDGSSGPRWAALASRDAAAAGFLQDCE